MYETIRINLQWVFLSVYEPHGHVKYETQPVGYSNAVFNYRVKMQCNQIHCDAYCKLPAVTQSKTCI